jgi:mRNA interferase RelE/StbE
MASTRTPGGAERWRVEISAGARKALGKLDPQAVRSILTFLNEKVARAGDLRRAGKPLVGSTLGNFWCHRAGDYRVIADIQDETVTVLVVRIGHRREVYR